MKIIPLFFIGLFLLVTSVSAEITYSDQFYQNQNTTHTLIYDITKSGIRTYGFPPAEYAIALELRNTNELLIKQNELLQEKNNLTATQNQIFRGFYNLLRSLTGGFAYFANNKKDLDV